MLKGTKCFLFPVDKTQPWVEEMVQLAAPTYGVQGNLGVKMTEENTGFTPPLTEFSFF